MKTHSSQYKENIKLFGREIDCKIIYTIDEEEIILQAEELNSITPHYEGSLLKSTMKQLDIDSNVDIPLNTVVNAQFGLKVGNSYEYIDLGNYIVYSSEKQEDTKSYKIVCYDYMLNAMKNYVDLEITYPITIKNYIIAICNYLDLDFKNENETFTNYNKEIETELYLDGTGNSLGYTFRDVIDELAQVTASTICINKDDELEIRYINNTNDNINEEYLKDVNVNFGEKYGPINSVVLTRSGGSDSIYENDTESIEQNGLCEIKIEDNQIMNFNNRSEFLQEIFNRLDGLEYYINDYTSTGITYYDICDRYNVIIGNNTYSCVMFNDEINITQGLEEKVFTKMPEETETEYKYASKEDRQINQAYIITKKNQAEIEALASKVVTLSNTISGIGNIELENAYEGTLHRLEVSGNITPLTPSEILTPSEDLYPKDTYLVVDEDKYYLDIDYLSYTSLAEHDTFVYEDGKCWIERINGTKEEKEDVLIEVKKDSEIYMEQYPNAIFRCTYLLQNDYTDTFTNSLDIVSKINMSPEQIEIDSRKISLTGKTIDLTSDIINIKSKYFNVDSQGHLTATSATLQGSIRNFSSQTKKLAIEIRNTNLNFYDYRGTGTLTGGVTPTRGTIDNVPGICLFTTMGSRMILGYGDNEDNSHFSSIIEYDTNNLSATPWIKNTANGTLFSRVGTGIVVENGLIKSWHLETKSGTIQINEPDGDKTYITVNNGLITNWEYVQN